MKTEPANVESIFLEAVERLSVNDRTAYLDEACAGDSALRSRVEALLKAHDDAGSFLVTPAFAAEPCETDVLAERGHHRAASAGDNDGETDEPALDFLDPPRQPGHLGTFGPYDIVELVGHGGMGVVLKALDPRLNRVVAIKVLAPALASNAAARKRFLREAQAAAAVTHDHVITIHAIEEAKNLPYLVMEYVAGQSLQQKIDATGPLELKEILRIGRQIAAGLAAAHQQGLIHRDIKPANILLENGVERVKITDFGLARAVGDAGVTQTGMLAGTPQYMSPEQAQGERVDHRSDLFSLGCVLYAMCTGRSPFRAEGTVAVIHRVCKETPRAISQINPDMPDWLTKIIDLLLEKDAEQRFHSAGELEKLLGMCLAHVQQPSLVSLPAIPCPASSSSTGPASQRVETLVRPDGRSRLVEFARNHRGWATAAAIFVLLPVGLGMTEATGVTKVGEFVATVLQIRTTKGTLVVELSDDAVSVEVDADGETITLSGIGPHEIKLRPGFHRVRFLEDGEALRTEEITINRGDRRVVKLTHHEQEQRIERVRRKAKQMRDEAVRNRRHRAAQFAEEARQLQKQWATQLSIPAFDTNSMGMNLALVPPDAFDMGSDEKDIDLYAFQEDWFFSKFVRERLRGERPKHRVELTKPVYMGVHEVTVGQFKKFIEASGYKTTAERDGRGYGWRYGEWVQDVQFNWRNPGFAQPDAYPVNNVSWDDAVEFCKWLSEKEQAEYRLPTEAEWEYACRATSTTQFYSGDGHAALEDRDVANIADRELGVYSIMERQKHRGYLLTPWAGGDSDNYVFPAPVGSFRPNGFGLHDMHGNVWEWCSDWYDPEYYRVSPRVDPQGPATGEYHVFRGGGWDNHPIFCRSADRYSSHSPTLRTDWAGFRVVKVIASTDAAAREDGKEKESAEPPPKGKPPLQSKDEAPPLPYVIDPDARSPARAVAIANDRLAIGRENGTYELWALEKGTLIHSKKLPAPVTAVALSADGVWAAAARGKEDSREAMVQMWDLSLKENLAVPVQIGGGPVGPHAPDWNVNTGQVRALAFSPNGKRLAAGAGDDQAGELIVWSTEDFQIKSRFPGFTSSVRLIFFATDDESAGAGSSFGDMQVLDLKTGKSHVKMNFAMMFPQLPDQPKLHLVQAVALLPPERGLVVTGDSKGRVEIRDAINGQRLHAFQAHELAVDAIALSPDGKALATVGRDEGGVNVWNVEKITSAVKEPEKVRAN
jgi:formylglycine-generating enzyme required for sulfatase activity/serine/threonine protein kinase